MRMVRFFFMHRTKKRTNKSAKKKKEKKKEGREGGKKSHAGTMNAHLFLEVFHGLQEELLEGRFARFVRDDDAPQARRFRALAQEHGLGGTDPPAERPLVVLALALPNSNNLPTLVLREGRSKDTRRVVAVMVVVVVTVGGGSSSSSSVATEKQVSSGLAQLFPAADAPAAV